MMPWSRRELFATTIGAGAALLTGCGNRAPAAPVLSAAAFRHYIDGFNAADDELYVQHIPNAQAWDFLKDNIPLLECPDEDIERTFYFRWWTYRKHIKETPDGFVITEFLPAVSWAGKYNTINCAAGHHFREGRWLHEARFLDDYSIFWFRKGGSVRSYSFWAADSMWARYLVSGDREWLLDLLPDLVENYKGWEAERLGPEGLFWQIDDRDGMEVSIGGSGYRATINSYMYGDAVAIGKMARLAGQDNLASEYEAKAENLRQLVLERLWVKNARFFQTISRKTGKHVGVREEHGFTPWYFRLPRDQPGEGYEAAWEQLMDPKGFYAPYGPTTAEQRHPGFQVSYEGHECQWNGPSWPYATTQTLVGLANVLNDYDQDSISRRDYFETLRIYTRSHQRTREDGTVVPWIDEDLNPFTGEWLARKRLKDWGWDPRKGGRERGKDYNHSAYCDLVITGLIGLRPRADDRLEVNPLLPDGEWNWFCLDRVKYRGRLVTILWDKTGEKYGRGTGLAVFADGREIGRAPGLARIEVRLPKRGRLSI